MKIKFHLFKLFFPHGLHLSRGSLNTDHSHPYLHSDAILAALMQVYSQWGMDPEELKTMVLSSAFPFVKNGDKSHYFFPKVFFPQIKGFEDKKGFAKQLKKIAWLEHESFEALVNGDFQFKESFIKDSYYSSGATPQMKNNIRLRTRVGRDKEETRPYYIDEISFSSESGLYFLCIDQDENQLKQLRIALKMLEDAGVGTDRSVGKGNFYSIESDLELNLPENANYALNLGVYLPNDLEEWKELTQSENHRYELLQRGGWFDGSSPFIGRRKNSVNMIREGGLWSKPLEAGLMVKGRVADLAPQSLIEEGLGHPVYRSGKSLFIPLNLESYEL